MRANLSAAFSPFSEIRPDVCFEKVRGDGTILFYKDNAASWTMKPWQCLVRVFEHLTDPLVLWGTKCQRIIIVKKLIGNCPWLNLYQQYVCVYVCVSVCVCVCVCVCV